VGRRGDSLCLQGTIPSLAKLMLTNSAKEEALLRRRRARDGDLGLW